MSSIELRRIKWIAFKPLAGAARLYFLAKLLRNRHPAGGYVAVISEAAMVA